MNSTYSCFRQMIKLQLAICVLSWITINHAYSQHLETVIQKGHELAVLTVAVSPDSSYVATGSRDKTIKLWELCGGCYTDVQFTPDSKYLIKASNNDAVLRYDLSNGKAVTTYSKEVEDLKSVAVSTTNKLLVLCTENFVTLYHTDRGDSLKTIRPDTDAALNQATLTADGKHVLIACDNNTVLIYNSTNGKKVSELTGFLNSRDKGGITYDPNNYWDANITRYLRYKGNVILSRDNKSLLRGKFGTKAKRWDIATGKGEMEYVGHEKAVLCYRYNREGNLLLTGGADGMLILWDAKKGDTLRTIKSYNEPVFDVNFSYDETKIVSSSWDGTLKIHEVATGKRLQYIDLDNASAYLAQFTPNDLYVVTASLPTGLALREIDTKKVIREFIGHTETVSAIQLTQDGRKLFSASWDGSLRLWDVGTGLMEKKFTAHQGAVFASVMTANEKNFFSAGADRIIRYWDMNSGKVIKTLIGHQSEVISLALTSDEKMLISHSVDGVTKFWDLTTGKEFFEHIHIGDKDWMAKSPEGYFNATEQARRYIHFVDGMKTYSADQFFEDFYRPDLLSKIFQSRGGDDGYKNMQGKLLKSPPPQVKVALLPSTEIGKAQVYVRVQDNGAGVENLKLFHNGKSVAIDKNFTLPKGKGQTATFRQEISLVGGNNVFSATASNADKIEADLQSAAGGSLHKNLEIHTLYDAEATRSGILNKLDELAAKIHQEDVFIFYYAGHGSMVEDKFFFIPTESLRLYDLSALTKEAIEGNLVQEKLKKIKALKQLIIMDACQSGGSVELMAARGATEEKAIAQLSRSAGIHVMASAGSEQFAAEFAELGHGIFTYLLIKGLSGEADGSPKDGKVTIYELKSFLDDQVPELTRKLKGKPQYPHTFSRGQDFPLVVEE
ncbi:MAG: hypothetical protein EBR30_04195 [Cytophagia bacterium]|nr:hypothetical protein [Cytophagia bacterium]